MPLEATRQTLEEVAGAVHVAASARWTLGGRAGLGSLPDRDGILTLHDRTEASPKAAMRPEEVRLLVYDCPPMGRPHVVQLSNKQRLDASLGQPLREAANEGVHGVVPLGVANT